MKIGYARVSTDEQNLALQLHALDAAGYGEVFQDRGMSGAASARPGLLAALERAGEGDTLAVWRIDRLGRSTLHLLQILEYRLSVDHGRNRHEHGGGPHGVFDGRRNRGIRAQRDFRKDKGGHGGGASSRASCGPSGKTRAGTTRLRPAHDRERGRQGASRPLPRCRSFDAAAAAREAVKAGKENQYLDCGNPRDPQLFML
jgi:hypothetical protein